MSSGSVAPLLAAAGLLVAASAGGLVLRARLSPRGGASLETVAALIRGWWALAILIALASLFGRTGVVLLFALCSFAALREFVPLTGPRRADRGTLALALLVVPLQSGLLLAGQYGLLAAAIPVYCFLFVPTLAALRGGPEGFVVRAAEIQWALMLCVFCASHIAALLTLEFGGHAGRGVLLVAFLVMVVQTADVLRQFWDARIGRRRIAPRLSPGRTLEGFAGGVLSAAVLGALLFWMTPFSPLQAAAMGIAIAVAGAFGGLVMSAIGQDRDGDGGHGGLTDRFASVLFAAPVFFHLTLYGWA